MTRWYRAEPPATESLRETDRRYHALDRSRHVLWSLWFVCFVAALGVAWWLVGSGTIGDSSAVASAAGVAVGAAAGLGGIAATLFFITAQLQVAGVSRRGLIELYRVRLLVPILVSTVSIIVAGSTAILLPRVGSGPGRFLAVFALVALVPFLIAVVHLAVLSLVYFEPLSVAQQFANALTFTDVDEWQLLDLQVGSLESAGCVPLRCEVRSNRMNFGLRDPLMPIQELIEHARNKELGRLESVLIGRVTEEFRLPWTQQAPDPDLWELSPGLTRRQRVARLWRRVRRHRTDRTGDDLEPTRRRLALLLLVVHYFRRLPSNRAIEEIPADVRRQQTQFLLCRLAFVLAHQHDRRDRRVVRLSRDVLRDAERRTALILVVYAIAGLSGFFRTCPSTNRIEPPWALTATAVALKQRGWEQEYRLVIDTLAWLRTRTPHITHSWDDRVPAGPSRQAREDVYRDVAARLPQIGRQYPTMPSVQDPWRDLRTKRFTPNGP